MDFNEQVNEAISMCENKTIDLSFSTIYPFTTENISGYINDFNLDNKSLLTVGSSCDQVINASLKNCTDISVLDICPFTKYYFYLKKAVIMTLSYKEFSHFFCYKDYSFLFGDNRKAFDKDVFYKIEKTLKELDNESYLFWSKLFSNYSSLKIRKKLFSPDEYKFSVLKNINLYLSDDEKYNASKYKLENINPKFIMGSISNVKLDRKYDNIWLSNLGQYMDIAGLKKIVDNLFGHLNEKGKMLVSYLYKIVNDTEYNNDWASVYNLKEVFKLFEEYSPELKSFMGTNHSLFSFDSKKDSVIVLQKKRS